MLEKLKEITIGIVITLFFFVFFKNLLPGLGKKTKAKQVVWVWNTSSWQ